MTKHAALVLLALLVMLVATCRLRSHPASGGAGSMVYVPIAQQGAPRCNRWRGDDWWPCVEATLTAEARVSRTPRPTSTATRDSATWAPGPYEPLWRVWLPITADVTGPGRDCSAAPAGPRTVWLAGSPGKGRAATELAPVATLDPCYWPTDVRPCGPADNGADKRRAGQEDAPDFGPRDPSGAHVPHCQDVLLGKSRPSIAFSDMRHMPLSFEHIAGVLGVGSESQVGRIYAAPIVAGMKNMNTGGDVTIYQDPGSPMGKNRSPSVVANPTISIRSNVSGPFPTIPRRPEAGGVINAGPKIRDRGLRNISNRGSLGGTHRNLHSGETRRVDSTAASLFDANNYSASPLITLGEESICSSASVGDGVFYIAAHCIGRAPWRYAVGGWPVTGWQFDPTRDLAQVRIDGEVAGGWPSPALARLALGDVVVMRPARGPVGGVYAGDAWADRSADGYYMTTFERAGTRAVGAVCADVGAIIRMGDSGGGVYRAADGSLGGIVVASEAWAGDSDVWCGGGQVVVVVSVP